MKNLWGGRFSKQMDDYTADYNESISFDHILYPYSIEASIAHVSMLAKQGIISQEECEEIIKGLKIVKENMDNGLVEFDIQDEDIMMTIEKNLIAKIGDVGKKLHTARSRNDQNAVDEKLFLRDATKKTVDLIKDMMDVIIQKALGEKDIIMPGFTHMQHAQPITVGFYYMAHFQGFKRDAERFISSYDRLNRNPLGACALAGTTLPTDRMETTKTLGFSEPTDNAMDTVGDRDFIAEYLFNAALCMNHISGFAEEIIVFNSQEFNFIDIDDSFCTGSSIMPQKKNPDIAELARGKAARTIGNLTTIMTMLKGTFLTLNKDYQEDKEPLFDSIHTLNRSLYIFARMLEKISFREEVLKEHLKKGFINATDIAEYLVCCDVPFRDAHEIVGSMVKYCEGKNITFEELTPEDLAGMRLPVQLTDLSAFSIENCVKNRKSLGGTSPEDVDRQIGNAKAFLKSIEKW